MKPAAAAAAAAYVEMAAAGGMHGGMHDDLANGEGVANGARCTQGSSDEERLGESEGGASEAGDGGADPSNHSNDPSNHSNDLSNHSNGLGVDGGHDAETHTFEAYGGHEAVALD